MRPLIGGAEVLSKCNKTGDTIVCTLVADVTLCKHFEGACPSKFSSECSISSSIMINCPNKFTIS